MDLYSTIGKIAVGSRLRLMATKVTEDAVQIYKMYGVELAPKWFPVFYALSKNGEMAITEIAKEIEHSQPSVSKIVKEMKQHGLIEEQKSEKDKRSTLIVLTKKGQKVNDAIKDQYTDVESAIQELIQESTHNLWEALEEWNFHLNQKSLYKRVIEQKKLRESQKVKIVAYEDQYRTAFKDLNKEWIDTYFEMEEADYKSLDHPKEYILDKGGEIFIALYDGKPVGACALIKMQDADYDFELSKMAVSPLAKGKGIGWLLGQAIITKAKELGASKLYLESNTVLTPAINLYYKLGFKKVKGDASAYSRCNIQMALDL